MVGRTDLESYLRSASHLAQSCPSLKPGLQSLEALGQRSDWLFNQARSPSQLP
jgi:hypothetical protein